MVRDDRGEQHTLTGVQCRKCQCRGMTRGIGKIFEEVSRRICRGIQVRGTHSLMMGGRMDGV